MASKVEEDRRSRFCVLEYRPRNWRVGMPAVASVILLVFRDNDRKLRFLVHPELHTIVQSEDFAYLESLLRDFLERARQHPEDLFNQLCSLGVGPLVTQEVGANVSDYPALLELSLRFVEL